MEITSKSYLSPLSTPKGDGSFNVYDDMKQKLMAQGVPPEEIAFIHDAKTEAQKAELFAKVRKGQVRVLLGSTAKMGAGTNVQTRLAALHHLDCPWRPADIEQREGRILRQGNINKTVKIYKYVTENTFDAYNWSILENKQKFIGQLMSGKNPSRSCEDVDEAALSYAEVKALASGDPRIIEMTDLDSQVTKLKLLKANHESQRYSLEDQLIQFFPKAISRTQEQITGLEQDFAVVQSHPLPDKEHFSITPYPTQPPQNFSIKQWMPYLKYPVRPTNKRNAPLPIIGSNGAFLYFCFCINAPGEEISLPAWPGLRSE